MGRPLVSGVLFWLGSMLVTVTLEKSLHLPEATSALTWLGSNLMFWALLVGWGKT